MLPSFNNYPYGKNLRDRLIHSSYIDDQRILQSDWLRAFKAISEELDFPQICSFHRATKNTVIHHLWGRKRHMNGLNFLKKPKKPIFEELLDFFPKRRLFLKKLALSVFDTLTTSKTSGKSYESFKN